MDLLISGEEEPIGTTDSHPFWSEDRQEYVPAGELRVGENLRTVNGSRTYVQSIRPRGPPEDVYNLEVEGAHTYHVGTTGVLVHNSCVYRSAGDGPPSYVGITNNFPRRSAEHAQIGREITPIIDGITRKQARALEHLLIEKYGRIANRAGTPLGGILQNVIRGIDPSKLHKYKDELDWAMKVIVEKLL